MSIIISSLKAQDIPVITARPSFLNHNAPAPYFQKLLAAQEKREIVFLVARYDGEIAGFLYIKWQADYPPFAEKNIPEIKDLRVLKEYRRQGVATALMDEAEKRIFQRAAIAGLGVGLYADYGNAQRMYVKRGYIPEGRGLVYKNRPVKPGSDITVDDDLLLYFTKGRKR